MKNIVLVSRDILLWHTELNPALTNSACINTVIRTILVTRTKKVKSTDFEIFESNLQSISLKDTKYLLLGKSKIAKARVFNTVKSTWKRLKKSPFYVNQCTHPNEIVPHLVYAIISSKQFFIIQLLFTNQTKHFFHLLIKPNVHLNTWHQ